MGSIPCMSDSKNQQKRNFERLPVATFNPNPKWPGDYFEVLAEAGVPERQHSFYAHWVRQFFNRNPGRSRRSLGVKEIAGFLGELKSDDGMESWQVEQARTALIVYYEQFRGIALGDLSVLDAPAEESATQSREAVNMKAEPERRIPPPRAVEKVTQVPRPSREAIGERRADMAALREAVLKALRTEHYALKTEKTYWNGRGPMWTFIMGENRARWVRRRYMRFSAIWL